MPCSFATLSVIYGYMHDCKSTWLTVSGGPEWLPVSGVPEWLPLVAPGPAGQASCRCQWSIGHLPCSRAYILSLQEIFGPLQANLDLRSRLSHLGGQRAE